MNGHRLFALLAMLLTTAIGAFAQKVSLSDVSVAPGESVTVSINLENDADFVGSFAGDIYLPEGFEVTNYGGGAQGQYVKKTSRVPNSFSVVSTTDNENVALADNQVRVNLVGLNKTKPLAAGSGAILEFEITAPWDFDDAEVKIELKDATISDGKGGSVKADCKASVRNADLTVTFSAEDVEATPNQETTISINMDNVPNVAGFNGTLTLPEGLSLVLDEEGDYCTPSSRLSFHQLSYNEKTGVFLAFAMPPSNISGNSGEVFSITVKGDANLAKESVITLTDMVATPLSGAEYPVDDIEIKVTNPDVDAAAAVDEAIQELKDELAAAQEALKEYDEAIQEEAKAEVEAITKAIEELETEVADAKTNGTVAADLDELMDKIDDISYDIEDVLDNAEAAKEAAEEAAAKAAEDAQYQENVAAVAQLRKDLEEATAAATKLGLDPTADNKAATDAINDFSAKVEANHAANKSVEAAEEIGNAQEDAQAKVDVIADAVQEILDANADQYAEDSEAVAAAQKVLDDAKAAIANYDQSVQDGAKEAIEAAQKAIDDAKAAVEKSHNDITSVADAEANAKAIADAKAAAEQVAADAAAAQKAWEEAQKPKYEKATIADGDYYIKNVESGLFLTGSNSWGTQASLNKAGVLFTITALENGGYSLLHTLVTANNKYLGSNLFVDSTTPEGGFEFYTVDGDIAIGLGEKFLAQGEAGKTFDATVVALDEVTDAAKWVLLTRDEAIKGLEAATADAPVDATFLIKNPGFNRNTSTADWTAEASNKNLSGGDNDFRAAESWQSSFTVSQTIENIPNGVYEVGVQAAITDYTGAYDGTDYPVLFANDEVGGSFISMEEGDRGTNMTQLAKAFANGYYVVEPVQALVSDGTLTIGVKGTRTDTWCIWDNFQVKYLGEAKAEPANLAEGKYYLQNIESGRYWGEGNNWGTRAALVKNPEYVTLISNEDGTYKMETQVSNGGTAYYFEGDYMDNGNPKPLTIMKVGNYYTISSDAGFYGYDPNAEYNGTVLGKGVDENSKASHWNIISEEEMIASLANATDKNPVDATFLLLDPNFGRNNRNQSAWTIEASNKNLSGGNNNNNCAESFHSVFTLSQAIENAPAGVYKVTAQGFYRQDGEDNDNLPYFYANEETSAFPLKTGTENSMSEASVSFSNGLYAAEPIFVELAEAGTLTVGAKLEENTSLWCIWDNFEVTYYGADTDILSVKLGDLVAQLAELRKTAEELKGDETLPASKVADLEKALADTEEVEETAEAYNAAIETLSNAIGAAQAFAIASPVLEKMKELVEATNVYTEEAYEEYYGQWVTKLEEGTITLSEAQALQDPSVVTGWHAAITVDNLLLSAWDTNPDFNNAPYYINSWSVEGESDGTEFRVPFFEYWTGDANSLGEKTLTATLNDMDPGEYSVTAWVRVRAKDETAAADATGITFSVNDGEAVDVTEGEAVEGSQFNIGTYTAKGVVGDDGVLTIKFNVAADNNISWLSFKNVKYEAPEAELVYTDLTKEMFHDWSAADGTAEVTVEEAFCDYKIGEGEVGAGTTVYGNGGVLGQSFADLTDYNNLVLTVKSGQPRILLNVVGQADPKTFIELNANADKPYFTIDGETWTVDLDGLKETEGVEYVHLNTIKIGWGGAGEVADAKLGKVVAAEPEIAINVERYPGMGYSVTTATIDFTAAKDYLGVEEITYDMIRIVNPDGTQISDYAPYDGWFNEEGVAETWGDNTKICVKFFQMIENGQYEICDMNGADELGKTYSVKWALTANDKTYTYKINVKFVEKPVIAITYDDLNKIDEPSIAFESETEECYEGLTSDVDVAAILSKLGVESLSDVTIYAVQSDGSLDDNYKLGTTDGWRNAAGDWQSWGADAYLCVKVDFAAAENQIYYVGGMEGNTGEAASYTAKFAFVKNGSTDAVVLSVTLTYSVSDAIANIETAPAKANGKYLENGKVVIIKNGVKYNAAGVVTK